MNEWMNEKFQVLLNIGNHNKCHDLINQRLRFHICERYPPSSLLPPIQTILCIPSHKPSITLHPILLFITSHPSPQYCGLKDGFKTIFFKPLNIMIVLHLRNSKLFWFFSISFLTEKLWYVGFQFNIKFSFISCMISIKQSLTQHHC